MKSKLLCISLHTKKSFFLYLLSSKQILRSDCQIFQGLYWDWDQDWKNIHFVHLFREEAFILYEIILIIIFLAIMGFCTFILFSQLQRGFSCFYQVYLQVICRLAYFMCILFPPYLIFSLLLENKILMIFKNLTTLLSSSISSIIFLVDFLHFLTSQFYTSDLS